MQLNLILILTIILTVLLSSFICYASDTYPQNTTVTPILSNVTYNLTRALVCDSVTVHNWCFNITGGDEAYNYCNTSATDSIIQVLAPPVIDTYEPLSGPILSELSNYSFNITWHDADEYANIDWYMNSSNQTAYWNLTTFNTSVIVLVGEYNITVVVSDNNGSTYHEWIITNVTNIAPNITSVEPTGDVNITEVAPTYSFNVTVSDDDGNPLDITWYLNGSNQTDYWNLTTFNYTANYSSAGDYNVTIAVTDSIETTSFQWNMTVANVVPSGAGGGVAPITFPEVNYTLEQKCELLYGLWLTNEIDNTSYCKIVGKQEYWINKMGSYVWPSQPSLGFAAGLIVSCLVILLLLLYARKYLILVKDDEEEEKKRKIKRIKEGRGYDKEDDEED